MHSGYSGRGRPSRAAAAARRTEDYDDDDIAPTKPAGRGRGAGRPRGKATAAAQRHPVAAARGGAASKNKSAGHSVVSALAKGINRCEQCGIEFYQQPPFAQSSWMWIVYEALRRLHDEGKPHRKYFHYKLDICNYIDRNWISLCPSKKRTPTWNNTVSAVITTHPKLFKSNRKQSGYWTLKKLTPGGNDGSSDEEEITGTAPAVMEDYDSGLGEHQGGVDIGRVPKSKRQQQILIQQQQAQQVHMQPPQHHLHPHLGVGLGVAPGLTIAPLATTVTVPMAPPTASILSSKKRTHSEMLSANPGILGVPGIVAAPLANRRRKPNPAATPLVQTSLASTVASTLASSSSASSSVAGSVSNSLSTTATSVPTTLLGSPLLGTPSTPSIVEPKVDTDKPSASSSGPSSSSNPTEHIDFMEHEWNRGPFKPSGYDAGSWTEMNEMDLDNPQMLTEENHGSAGPSAW